eukprot:CAMPEP_0181207062 /NCGR_PEP_ID=MMETSP1096-20121128/21374_1 /TAXON_ID=156174 ORGANISM="Chrysochromulina ericina, Strain CCMP281" /NCGR_SAMPLE_ID=MMETSP1096 /ASSEMBLY_ACC=CAM_ASM_000453 /LENGTH=44 /DNA_ID= /DNA_START= /DNA_END= /DNA_ORIENTATION=
MEPIVEEQAELLRAQEYERKEGTREHEEKQAEQQQAHKVLPSLS